MYTPMHSDALSRPTITGGPMVPRSPEDMSRPLSDGTRRRKGRRVAQRKAANAQGSRARRTFLLLAMALASTVRRM